MDLTLIKENLSSFIDLAARAEPTVSKNDVFRFPTSNFLINLGFPKLEMQISEYTVRKILDYHGVNRDFLSNLPILLNNENGNYIAKVFKSRTKPNSSVVVSFEFVGEKPILIAIEKEKQVNTNLFVNQISSVYEKDNALSIFHLWNQEGLKIYTHPIKTLTPPKKSVSIRIKKKRRT